jgi:hypothetical protein
MKGTNSELQLYSACLSEGKKPLKVLKLYVNCKTRLILLDCCIDFLNILALRNSIQIIYFYADLLNKLLKPHKIYLVKNANRIRYFILSSFILYFLQTQFKCKCRKKGDEDYALHSFIAIMNVTRYKSRSVFCAEKFLQTEV